MSRMIQMVDLKGQYLKIKNEIDEAIGQCIDSASFINGPQVANFSGELARYLCVKHVIPCANGTDALQIAFMALGLQQGDEVIVPAFTYVATAEVIALLGLKLVMVDVDPKTFNITAEHISKAITEKTRAIVPVHLFGQSADMEPILQLAERHKLYVIEDNAQAIGSQYTFSTGEKKYTGTIGHIGTTSFFPSKNLGCFGDGGAITTNDTSLAVKMQMIANHGQSKKYYHSVVGINSRLDTIQAGILSVKLRYLDKYICRRQTAAAFYDEKLSACSGISLPYRNSHSTHVFHQYTIQVNPEIRNSLKVHLSEHGIPSMIYYPVPLQQQEAYMDISHISENLAVSEQLSGSVLSLPMHTELDEVQLEYICSTILDFFTPKN